MIDPSWLGQDVPLYAFIAALLTKPAAWSGYVKEAARRLYEQRFGEDSS